MIPQQWCRSGLDPVFMVSLDTDWIRIPWCPWIRIRIRNQDPGGQKWRRKIETVSNFRTRCSLLRAEPVAWTSYLEAQE
jgi:hypothetical protein